MRNRNVISRVLLFIWDGLRPDFVTPELTPNLIAFAAGGVKFTRHHAVFPTETRVNSSSIATGCYPGTHGIVGNSIYVPGLVPGVPVNTGDHEVLQALQRHPEGLLSVPTVGEILGANGGRRIAVVSSGSPGSSFLQNVSGNGPMVNVRGIVFPESFGRHLVSKFGEFPDESVPTSAAWNDRALEILLGEILTEDYAFTVLWLCDPDKPQHKAGLGSNEALQAIRENDSRLGRILDVAVPMGMDLLVGSDHGFSTLGKPADLNASLIEAGFDVSKLVLVSGGIFLREPDQNLVERLAEFLQEQPWVGPVFSRGKGDQGDISGTISMSAAMVSHSVRSPDLAYSRIWSDEINEFGVPGFTYGKKGVATHGTCCPRDLHNVLVASGPSFKEGITSETPSGNVDIAPTVLSILGISGNAMDGRVLTEAIEGGPDPDSMKIKTDQIDILTISGKRVQHLEFAEVEGTRYLEQGWVSG